MPTHSHSYNNNNNNWTEKFDSFTKVTKVFNFLKSYSFHLSQREKKVRVG